MSQSFATRASDLRAVSVRSTARHLVLSALGVGERFLFRHHEALRRPRVHILSLHHILDDEVDPFRRLLGRLASTHTFISYGEAVSRIQSGAIDKPFLTFTFDDGFASSGRAAGLLEEVGARACFFVVTRAVGLSDKEEVVRFCRERMIVKPMPFLDWDSAEQLVRRGHSIGSHTRTHANLATLSPAQLEDEIAGSAEDLRGRLGAAEHFAWPFGRFFHFSAAAARAVFDAGFVSCASGERGAHVIKAEEPRLLCLRRDHILADWPQSHVFHFLAASSRAAGERSNRWPENIPAEKWR